MSATILEEYDERRALFETFTVKIAALLDELLFADGLRVHSVTWRVKKRDSLATKLAKPDKVYTRLSDITDICGVRITTYFAKDVDLLASLIAREFAVDTKNSPDKRALMESDDRFGYLSVHQVVALSPARLALRENVRFDGLKVEIQTRSILQHAWAEIEHDLGYKAGSDLPGPVRRRFSRLAGLLELADDEFARLREELGGLENALLERIRVAPELVTVDETALRAFIYNDPLVTRIDAEIVALSETWSQGEYDVVGSALARKFLFLGVNSIGQLRAMLARYAPMIAPLTRQRSDGWLNASVSRPRGDCLSYLADYLAARTKDVDLILTYYNITDREPPFKSDDEQIIKNLLADYELVTAGNIPTERAENESEKG